MVFAMENVIDSLVFVKKLIVEHAFLQENQWFDDIFHSKTRGDEVLNGNANRPALVLLAANH